MGSPDKSCGLVLSFITKTKKTLCAMGCLFLIWVVVILLVHSSAMPEKVVIRLSMIFLTSSL